MNKAIAWLLIYLICFSPIALAPDGGVAEVGPETGPSQESGVAGATDFQNYPTPENFMRLEQPTADNLLKVQSPTLENFQHLMDNNPQQAADYLEQRYDNDFAQTFYQNSVQSRERIEYNPSVAQRYFRENYGAEYTFSQLSEDFVFDQESGIMTNSGQTIILSEYSNRDTILGIEAVANGFIIRDRINDRERSVTLSGELYNTFVYNADTGQYSIDGIDTFSRQQDAEGQPITGDVAISIDTDGSVVINGPVQGRLDIVGQNVRYVNRRGTLRLSADGDIISENAEVITRQLYIDGTAHYDHSAGKVTIWDHGDGSLGNIRDGHTVVIYDTVGVVSQGQHADSGEQVEVFLDQISPYSRHNPADESLPPTHQELSTASTEEIQELADQRAEELRNAAAAVPLLNPNDLGESGQVSITRLDSNELLVTAKGRVEVGQYRENVRLSNEPIFQGRDGQAEYELRTNGETAIDLRGETYFSYDQGSIDTNQDRVALAIRIKDGDESIDAICSGCEVSDDAVVSIERDIVVGAPSLFEEDLFDELSRESFTLNVVVQEEGLHYAASTSDLENLAEDLKRGGVAILGRNVDMSIHSTETTEQLLRLSVPDDETQALSAYIETYENGHKVGESQSISFGVKNVIGEAIIVTTETNQQNVYELLTLIEEGQFGQLGSAGLEFDEDPALRDFILQETQIDISLIDNPEYLQEITEAVERQQEFHNFRERINEDYGIKIDYSGRCVSPPDCAEAINNAIIGGHSLGVLYTDARNKLLQAEIEALDAVDYSLVVEGMAPQENADQREANNAEIRELRVIREQISGLREERRAQREEERQAAEQAQLAEAIHNGDNPGNLDQWHQDEAYAVELGEWRESVENEMQELASEIGTLQRFMTTDTYQEWTPEQRANLQLQIDGHNKRLDEYGEGLEDANEHITDLYVRYATEDRHDLGVDLALEAGNEQFAAEVAAGDVAVVDSDRAYELLAQIELVRAREVLDEGGTFALPDASVHLETARQHLGSIADEEIAGEAESEYIGAYVRYQFEEEVLERRDLMDDAASDLQAYRNDPNEAAARFLGRDVILQYGAIALTDQTFDNPWLSDLREDEKVRALGTARDDYHNARDAARFYRENLEQGMSVEEAYDAIPEEVQRAIESSGTFNTFFHNIEAQTEGREISREDMAQAALDDVEAQISVQGGRTAMFRNDLEQISSEYFGTEAGFQAHQMLLDLEERHGLFTEETIQNWGDLALDVIDVTAIIPLGWAARVERLARLGLTAARAAERAEDLVTAARTLDQPGTFRRLFMGRDGRAIADNIATAESTALNLERAGDVAGVAEAARRAEELRIIQQAEQQSQSLSFLSRERRLFGRRELGEALDANADFRRQLAESTQLVAGRRYITPTQDLVDAARRVPETVRNAEVASFWGGVGKRLAGPVQSSQGAEEVARLQRALDDLTELGVTGREVENLEAARLVDEVDNIARQSGVSEDIIRVERETLDLLEQRAAAREAGELVHDDLAQQAVPSSPTVFRNPDGTVSYYDPGIGRVSIGGAAAENFVPPSGVLPTVTPTAASDRALSPALSGARQLTPAEARLLSSTPQSVRHYLPTVDNIDLNNVLQPLINERNLAHLNGDLARVRELDYQILGHPQVRPLVDDIAPGARPQLVQEFLNNGGDLARDFDYLTVKSSPTLAAAREQAITGMVAQKAEVVPVSGGVPVQEAALAPANAPLARVERVEEALYETTVRGVAGINNAPSPTQMQIAAGNELRERISELRQTVPGSTEFHRQADELYAGVISDSYGATNLPEFERRLVGQDYTLVEISMDRYSLKGLNDRNYEIGSAAIDSQHRRLIQFAEENGLEITTLQKTTFIAIPEGASASLDEVMAVVRSAEQSIANAVGDEIGLRVGLANSRSTLMETRLHTRRSLEYASQEGVSPTLYGDEVRDWYDGLSLEERANANDIFRGYDPELTRQFAELERLRGSDDLEVYRQQLSELAVREMQDAQFNNLEIVKSYLSDSTTGVRQGDAFAAIDGVSVGAANREDIIRLTNLNLPDEELAQLVGLRIDRNIAEVNRRIRDTYFTAVDRINIQPVEVLEEFSEIARRTGYASPELMNIEDLREFLRWEFQNYGKFRGGDETFMRFREVVLEANPDLAQSMQEAIRICGADCGFQIRVGVKDVAEGETFVDAIAEADRAVGISKGSGNVPIRITQTGEVIVPRAYEALIPEVDTIFPAFLPGYGSRQAILDDVNPLTNLLEQNNIHWSMSGSGSIADEIAALDQRTGDADLLISSNRWEELDLILSQRAREGTLGELGIVEYRPIAYGSATVEDITYGSSAKGSVILDNGQEIDIIAGFGYEIDRVTVISRGFTIEEDLIKGDFIVVEGFTLPVERISDIPGEIRYRVMAFDLDIDGIPNVEDFFRVSEEGALVMTPDALRVKYAFEGRYDRLELLDEIYPSGAGRVEEAIVNNDLVGEMV